MTRWGAARVEFVTLWPEIQRRLATGTPVMLVYQELVETGRITMSVKSFYKYCRRHGGPAKPAKPAPSSPSSPSKSPGPLTSPVTPSVPAPMTPSVMGASAVPVTAGMTGPSSLTATWTESPALDDLWGKDDAKTLDAKDGDAKAGGAITQSSGGGGTEGGDGPAPAAPADPAPTTDPE